MILIIKDMVIYRINHLRHSTLKTDYDAAYIEEAKQIIRQAA
jgi:hypothetical protein